MPKSIAIARPLRLAWAAYPAPALAGLWLASESSLFVDLAAGIGLLVIFFFFITCAAANPYRARIDEEQ